MSKLTASKQLECFNEVMTPLRKVSLNVVVISVDNASANRKFLVDCLCEGELKTRIIDPVMRQPIFLIFDPVHDLKNVYNNFQSRKLLECPAVTSNLPTGCTAHCAVPTYNWPGIRHVSKENPPPDSSCITTKKHRENIRQAGHLGVLWIDAWCIPVLCHQWEQTGMERYCWLRQPRCKNVT